ncbi:MAG: DUF423 domain-containing protein [Alphaproteobacteria bacterium]|nr:MAG: DUF423 domain-containing protein [Alphaproteobacteria bacterium]
MTAQRSLSILAALAGLLAVAAGAFGAHGLQASHTPYEITTFKTAASYQLAHALAMLIAADRKAQAAAIAFLLGMILFSGSLYFLVLTGSRALVLVTPAGGLSFMTGWALLAWSYFRKA